MDQASSSMMMSAPAPETETAAAEAPFAEGQPLILQGLSSIVPGITSGSRRLRQIPSINTAMLPSVINPADYLAAARASFAPVAETLGMTSRAPVAELGSGRLLLQETQPSSAQTARAGTAGLQGTTGGPAETASGTTAVQPIPGDIATSAAAGSQPGAGLGTTTGRAAAQPGDIASSASLGVAGLPLQQPSQGPAAS
jgi:hypothetical protein